ncbi:MAG: glycosyltransferase [Desulfatibacillaceae bacterium]
MDFTIAICTHNRADVLPRAVRAALAQDRAPDSYEVLVVPNACTDGTRTVLEELVEQYDDRLRYVPENRVGLSVARNTACAHARGRYVAYLDDDAEPSSDYLSALAEVFAAESAVGAVGGPIELLWDSPPPGWYEPGLDGHFSQLRLASYRLDLCYPHFLFGTNMAFPKRLVQQIGGFDARFGRLGNQPMDCEDAEIQVRIRKAGLRVVYEPRALVMHRVLADRVSVEYLVRKATAHGKSRCLMEFMHGLNPTPGDEVLTLAESLARSALDKDRGPLFERLARASAAAYIAQWFQLRLGGGPRGLLTEG